MTLHEALDAIGWTSTRGSFGGRHVYDRDGVFVGNLSASETWGLLRERGLLAQIQRIEAANGDAQ